MAIPFNSKTNIKSLKERIAETVSDKVSYTAKDCINGKLADWIEKHEDAIYRICYCTCFYAIGYIAGHSRGYGRAAIDCWKAVVHR